ncbi:hypothetical protein GCM10007417_17020 [Glycocaulis alkaliphilus]|nr:hypothetical protein GCM10007417_17020 [Glycocaulis alkaliphilus]
MRFTGMSRYPAPEPESSLQFHKAFLVVLGMTLERRSQTKTGGAIWHRPLRVIGMAPRKRGE